MYMYNSNSSQFYRRGVHSPRKISPFFFSLGSTAVNLQGHFLAATPANRLHRRGISATWAFPTSEPMPFPLLQIAPPYGTCKLPHVHVENGTCTFTLKSQQITRSMSMTRHKFCILSKSSSIISGLECVTAWCTACPTWAATLPTDMLRS